MKKSLWFLEMRLIVYRAPSYKSLALGTTRRICFTTRLADEGKQGTAAEQAAQAEREEAERAIYNSKQMRHFQAAMSNPVIKPYHQKRTPFQTKEKRRLIDQIRESRDQERSSESSDGKTETGVEEVTSNAYKKDIKLLVVLTHNSLLFDFRKSLLIGEFQSSFLYLFDTR